MLEVRPLFQINADVGEPQATPDGPYGVRRYIPVTGGTFKGDRLSGVLLPGGADSQLIRPDGHAELDVRVILKTNDDAIIYMKGQGIRAATPDVAARLAASEPVNRSEYYFREAMQFETPPGDYVWMNSIIAIGIGARLPTQVQLDVFEIL